MGWYIVCNMQQSCQCTSANGKGPYGPLHHAHLIRRFSHSVEALSNRIHSCTSLASKVPQTCNGASHATEEKERRFDHHSTTFRMRL